MSARLRARFAGLRGEPPATLWLIVAVLGAPTAWVVHLLASYAIVGIECNGGLAGVLYPLALLAATAALAAAGLTAGAIAYALLRPEAHSTLDTAAADAGGRVQFLAGTGTLLAAIFVLLIVLQGVVPLFVPTCAQIMRLAT